MADHTAEHATANAGRTGHAYGGARHPQRSFLIGIPTEVPVTPNVVF